MTHSHRPRALGMLAMALTTLLIVAAVLAGTAHADHPCAPPTYPGSGYFTSLEVSRTSCATGSKVVMAWYHCRTRHGLSGHCDARVLGFSCSERRVTIPTEYDARVTCHRRATTVIHTYQQNT